MSTVNLKDLSGYKQSTEFAISSKFDKFKNDMMGLIYLSKKNLGTEESLIINPNDVSKIHESLKKSLRNITNVYVMNLLAMIKKFHDENKGKIDKKKFIEEMKMKEFYYQERKKEACLKLVDQKMTIDMDYDPTQFFKIENVKNLFLKKI